MCGIFGFVSKKPQPTSIILRELKALEYRGYDSWGIAAKKLSSNKGGASTLFIEKYIGKVGSLKKVLNDTTLGIGHTRWATHGEVSINNAHPHLDCTKTLAVVHNGIFENFESVKEQLFKKGHIFLSQTDTEVIAHQIEEYLRSNDFPTSVRKTFNLMHGLNAIVVINSSENQIIAAKNGSPLIIGVSPQANYISSDISTLFKYTDKAIILKDNQMAILSNEIHLVSLPSGKKISYKTERIKSSEKQNTKGKYKHFLLKEIYDQPKILGEIYRHEQSNINRLAKEINNAYGTFVLGCGTASYAAMACEYFLSKIAKKHINFAVGSEFKYLQDFITKKSLIIPISQSGETIDVVEPVQQAKKKGATIIPIVNISTSTLARLANYSLLLHAGNERAVVGTKSFTSMIGLALLVSYAVENRTAEAQRLLLATSKDIDAILSGNKLLAIKALAKKLKNREHAFTIGRGISYIAALEAALKLKEASLVHAEGFAGGELKHGVIALIETGTPCFVFAAHDETYPEIISNAAEIKARGGFIIGIGPINNSVFDIFLETADLAEATIISQTVYMQLLAYFLALERGIKDPDKPRNLAKSVTVK